MAAKKKTETKKESQPDVKKGLAERLSIMDKICEQANASGLALAGRASDPIVKERLTVKYISTPSADINDALGGGFPKGKITLVAGLPDSGKTSLCLETIALMQKNDPEATAVWIESENSINTEIMEAFGVDTSRIFFLAQNKVNAAEGIIDLLTTILSSDAKPSIVVINSLKMLVPKGEIAKSAEKESVGIQARFNAKIMYKIVPALAENNTALVIVQALSTDLAKLYGDNKAISGGLCIRYNASIIIDLRKMSVLDADPIKADEGVKIKCTIKKNHCIANRNPYLSVEYFALFGKGIEQVLSTLKFLVEKGILTQRGSWIYWLDGDGNKQEEWTWNSKSSFREDMEKNPEKLQTLKSLIGRESAIKTLSDEEITQIEQEEEETASIVMQAMEEAVNV